MSAELTSRLLDLTRERRFNDVITVWKAAAAAAREVEIPKRLAAAALAQSGDLNAAASLLRELVSREAAEAASFALAARVFFDVGQLDASLDAWEGALAQMPGNLGWWKWFAEAAIRAGQPERALRGSEVHALHRDLNIDVALAHATLLTKAQRADEALIALERMVVRWPNHPVVGPAYAEFVLREFPLEAASLLDSRLWNPQPVRLSPARVRASLWMPAFFESEETAAEWRRRLLARLKELRELAQMSDVRGTERAACLATTPFLAAFHDADITDIQFAWGDFVEELVAPLRESIAGAASVSRGPVRKVGIVSNRLTDSSAGRFFNTWVEQLVAAGFDVCLYALGKTDHETERLSRLATLRRFPDDDVSQWQSLATQLIADSNDVLLFPEPQGSSLTMLVAGLRCAPIQCAAFGNPVTTGLHTMDYFLVPDAAEVPDPTRFYREKVVRLAGIGIVKPPAAPVSDFSRQSFGFNDDEHIYLINQQLQKWTPSFIDAVCEILQRDPSGRIAYFGVGSNMSLRAAQMYFRKAFKARGVDIASRTIFVTGLSRADYLALNRASDVSLDTFGYCGGSTTVDALSVGLPVITLEGRFLRSRQTAGMLRADGLGETVATSQSQFIELALLVAANRLQAGGHSFVGTNSAKPAAASASGGLPDNVVVFDNLAQFLKTLSTVRS
jgi:protein O-GlcNAc transferase